MSEQERILNGIRTAQRLMLERKAKLGESVVYADAQGRPYILTAQEALKRLSSNNSE